MFRLGVGVTVGESESTLDSDNGGTSESGYNSTSSSTARLVTVVFNLKFNCLARPSATVTVTVAPGTPGWQPGTGTAAAPRAPAGPARGLPVAPGRRATGTAGAVPPQAFLRLANCASSLNL
jgi:hypothetical protein